MMGRISAAPAVMPAHRSLTGKTRAGLPVVFALAILCVACWPRQKVIIGSGHELPPPQEIVLPNPGLVHAPSDSTTEVAMRNVLFHVDDDMRLGVRELRGRMRTLNTDGIKVLDDKKSLALDIGSAEIGLTQEAVTILLNRYVFGYPGSPLKDLVVRTEGSHIVQTGTMHKIIDIPFEMKARVSVTETGLVRIHPISMDICGLDGRKLLSAVGRTLADLLDLSGAKGARVDGNDILLDPLKSLPPPLITGRLTNIRVEGNELVQTFASANGANALSPLVPPVAASNYVYFRGGQIRFGKLYMVLTDLLAIDSDESDPFDFYLDYYHSQLVAGYHVTLPDYALVTWMPDFDDLGTERGKARQSSATTSQAATPATTTSLRK